MTTASVSNSKQSNLTQTLYSDRNTLFWKLQRAPEGVEALVHLRFIQRV
ncbi:malonyl-CoA decarboxylase N-terminal domain-containing protein [Rhizobium leguminosarum]|nr:hypothetical protein HB775_28730 [Rhizobium leguminosarum bv. trifolii]